MFKAIFLIFLVSCSGGISQSGRSQTQELTAVFSLKAIEDTSQFTSLQEIFQGSSIAEDYELIGAEGSNSKVELDSSDGIIYEPHKHFFGRDRVQLFLRSKLEGKVISSLLIVDVEAQPDPPSLYNDEVFDISNQEIVDVLRNDIDVDGDELELLSVESHDTITATIQSQKVILQPNDNFDSQGEISLAYQVRDSRGEESEAFIKINPQAEVESDLAIKLIFIGSSSTSEEGSCDSSSEIVMNNLKEKFTKNNQKFLKLSLDSCVDTIVDDKIHVHCDPRSPSCNDFDKVINSYGGEGVISLVFVSDIQGPVAGIAKLNKLASSKSAAVVAEKRSIARGGAVYTHELGHLFGLDHTQQVGLDEHNWVAYGSCGQSFTYFQRGYMESLSNVTQYNDENGVLWADDENIMKSELSSSSAQLDFFSTGYFQVFSKIFACYRSRSL